MAIIYGGVCSLAEGVSLDGDNQDYKHSVAVREGSGQSQGVPH